MLTETKWLCLARRYDFLYSRLSSHLLNLTPTHDCRQSASSRHARHLSGTSRSCCFQEGFGGTGECQVSSRMVLAGSCGVKLYLLLLTRSKQLEVTRSINLMLLNKFNTTRKAHQGELGGLRDQQLGTFVFQDLVGRKGTDVPLFFLNPSKGRHWKKLLSY